MKTWKQSIFFGILAILALAFALVACKDGNDPTHTHDAGSWRTILEPNCIATGTKELHCTSCDELLETETIDALGHNLETTENVTTHPTCEEDGIGELACTRCEYTKAGGIIDALGHNFIDNWSVKESATCEEDGEKERTCTRDNCNETETETIDALGHLYPEWIAPTCTEAGNSKRTCTRTDCGNEDIRTTGYTLLSHNWGNWAGTSPDTRTCQSSDCGINDIFDRSFSIGDTGPGGGKIFYKSENGFMMMDTNETCHYLEAAPNDTNLLNYFPSLDVLNSDLVTDLSLVIGSGRMNTYIILDHVNNAALAKYCIEYSNNGKTDWFLPSRDELEQLHENKSFLENLPDEASMYFTSSIYELVGGGAPGFWVYGRWFNNPPYGMQGNGGGAFVTPVKSRPIRAF